MKNCLICEKEKENQEEDLCQTCQGFFLSKKRDIKDITSRFKKSQEYLRKWRSSEKEVEEE